MNQKTAMIVGGVIVVVLILVGLFMVLRGQTPAPAASGTPATVIGTAISPAMLAYSSALGDWNGSWNNLTYNSTGTITMNLAISGLTLQTSITLGGNVFGVGAPGAIQSNADLTQTTLNLNLPATSILGQVTAQSFDPATGEITLTTKPTTNGISDFALNAKLDITGAPKITGTYTVTFTSGTVANGTILLAK